MKFVFAAAALAFAASPALAQGVVTTNEVFVEKTVTDAAGKTTIVLEPAKMVVPGTPLTVRLTYKNKETGAVTGYRLTNPIPDSVSFVETKSPDTQYSVDGGKSWGALAALKVKGADGAERPATAADVTHVQFEVARPIPPGGTGELSFRGVVK